MTIDILTPLSKKATIYSDLRKDNALNPMSRDLISLRDEEAVKESMVNLLMSARGEYLFQPEKGSDIKRMLFDNMVPASIQLMEQIVRDTLSNYEPRATIVSVAINPEYDNNRVGIEISYYVRNSQSPITVNIFLERTR